MISGEFRKWNNVWEDDTIRIERSHRTYDKQSDDELNEYIRSNAETAYHPCGTCKMGVDEMAVVDENLKVKGIQNLRVVDASIMPEIPSANLNAPTLMIAEKAADGILNA